MVGVDARRACARRRTEISMKSARVAGLALFTLAGAAISCTSILGEFDFNGGGGSTTSVGTSGTGTSGSGTTGTGVTSGTGTTGSGTTGTGATTGTGTSSTGTTSSGTAMCSDGVQDGTETDKDCGGSCTTKCDDAKKCAQSTDCLHNDCFGGTCISCVDTMQNGTESDTDCGGASCPGCPDTKKCHAGSDCVNANCSGGVCVSCMDKITNGGESDTDCGGPCSPCGYGRACRLNTDCATSFCVAGVCDAFTLAVGQGTVGAMALDAGNVYWVTGGSIQKVAKTSTAVTTLVSGQGSVNGLAVNATTAYFGISGGGIKSASTAAPGAATTFLTSAATLTAEFGIAVDSRYVYATSACNGCAVVIRAPFSGSPVTTFDSNLVLAYSVAVDLANVYWTTFGTAGAVWKASLGGGAAVTLVPNINLNPSYFNLAVDSANVYYVTGGGLFSVPIAGGSPTTVVAAGSGVENVVVDANYAYYNASGPGVYRTPKTGGAAQTLATPPGGASAGAIAIDATYVYWTTADGLVRQIAK